MSDWYQSAILKISSNNASSFIYILLRLKSRGLDIYNFAIFYRTPLGRFF